MHQQQMTYDELTPLEQCIADFVKRQQVRSDAREFAVRAVKAKKVLHS